MRFLRNPCAFKFEAIEKIMMFVGFERIGIAGSHYKYRHERLAGMIAIPVHNRECKKVYKRKIAKIINSMRYG